MPLPDDPRATIEELAQRIAGADYVKWQEQLADIWRLTQLLLIDSVERLVRESPAKPPEQLFAVMAETGRRLRAAEAASETWINLRTPAAFRAGLKQAEKQLAEQGMTRGLDFSWTLPNRRAVEQIAAETMGDLLQASRHVEAAVRQKVQQELLLETRRAVAAGMNQHAVAKRVAESLTEQGVFAVQDRRGRDIPIGRYAEIVGNVKLREVHTRGTIAGVQEHGGDLVRISTHIHRPDSCSPFEGKVYSLTGRTEGWPRLEKQTPFHPGCRHVTTPFVTTFRSDAEVDKIRAESNKPGQITVYPKREMDQLIEAQDKRQRFTRAKLAIRKADEKAVAAGTRHAPKNAQDQAAYERSLSARARAAMKRADAGQSTRRGRHSQPSSGPDVGGAQADEPTSTLLHVRSGLSVTLKGFVPGRGEDESLAAILQMAPAAHVNGLREIRLTYNELRSKSGSKANGLYDDVDRVMDLSRVKRRYYRDASRSAIRPRTGTVGHELGHHWYETYPDPEGKKAIRARGKLMDRTIFGVKEANMNEFAARAYQAFLTEAPRLAAEHADLYNEMQEVFERGYAVQIGEP